MKQKLNKIKNGSALVLTLFCMALLSVIGMGLIGLSMTQTRVSGNHYLSTKAYYIALAGISRARSQLGSNPRWAVDTPFLGSLNIEGEIGNYSVSVIPGAGNSKNTYKTWYVTSTGVIQGARRTVYAILETESLARFVMFTDSSTWVWGRSNPDSISGPMHSNEYFTFYGKPKFNSKITSSNQNDSYFNSNTRVYTQGGRRYTDPAKFYHYSISYDNDQPIAAEGSNAFYFAGGQPLQPMTMNPQEIRQNSTRVFEGNIYITFLEGGQMEIVSQNGTALYPTDNVTIYATGNIRLKGTVQGNITVIGNRDIYIDDNVVYRNKDADSLAIIATNYIILNTNPLDRRDIEINAMMFSLNSCFYVNQYQMRPPRGVIYLFGGIIQRYQGPTGLYNYSSGTLISGYSKDYVFDSRFLTKPPANFPVTGRILIKAWKDTAAIGN